MTAIVTSKGLAREAEQFLRFKRAMGMSYQRVWSLVAAMNADFVAPLVLKQRGGVAGGGAQLTPTGKRVLQIYRAIEHDAQRAVAKRLPQLLGFIRPEANDRA